MGYRLMSKPVADAIAAREEAKRPVEEPKPKRTRKKAEEPETSNTHEATVEVDYFGYAPEDDGS